MATDLLPRVRRGWSALTERQLQYVARLVRAEIAEQDGHATPAQKRLNARIRRKLARRRQQAQRL